jgi:hypothetical protein
MSGKHVQLTGTSDFDYNKSSLTDLRWVKSDTPVLYRTYLQASQIATTYGLWQSLPVEILIEILSDFSFKELLSFTALCRSFHHHIGNSSFLSLWLRVHLRRPLSNVYWFLPVPAVNGELEKFWRACEESKPSQSAIMTSFSTNSSIVFDANFPLFEFFRANYGTDSMKNRRRLWRISQQFRNEWYKYRTDGYEVKEEEESDNVNTSDDEDDSSGD